MAVRGKSDVWLRPWLCPSVIIVCRSGRHIFSRYFSCFLFAVQWSPSRILPAHLPQNYILTGSAFLFFSHFSLDLSSRPFPFHLFPIAESRKTCSITEKSINKYLFIFLILRIDRLFGLYFSSLNSRIAFDRKLSASRAIQFTNVLYIGCDRKWYFYFRIW